MYEESLISKFIEYELRYTVWQGHDATATYAERHEKRQDALKFINTSWFDVCCNFIGLDPNNVRRVTLKHAGDEIPEAQMLFQVVFEEREV